MSVVRPINYGDPSDAVKPVTDSCMTWGLSAGPKQVFQVTLDGKILRDGVDITNDDSAIAECFVAWVKMFSGIEIKREL